MLYKRILVPVDGSPLSSAAARAGIELAKDMDAQVIGLYVAPEFRYLMYGDMFPVNELDEGEYRQMETKAGEAYLKELQDVADEAKVKFTGKVAFSNFAANEIVETAEKDGCDLIFIGSHGRGGTAQLLLGSVTTKVLATCQIPVLVYREKKSS
jgi:nucleotide-binding universal stress UspA family protein